MKKILLIDDNLDGIVPYVNELKKRYCVVQTEYINSAEYLIKTEEKFDLIIIDIMMPSQDYSPGETSDGIRTGIVFYEKVIKEKINIPILFFSWNADFKSEVEKYSNVYFTNKDTNDKSYLVNAVNKFLD